MKILRAFKTELDPSDAQRTALLKHAGAARVAYNFGLRRKIDAYAATGKSPTAIDLHRELNVLKAVPKEDGGFSWMRESSKSAPQNALRDLDRAFGHFFRRCKNGAKVKGFPRFKSRKRGIGGFRLDGAISATATHVRLPRLGSLRLKEHGYLPTDDDTKVLSATVSEKAGRWFVSLQVEQELPEPTDTSHLPVIGVDVGIKVLATLSNGTVFENPKALKVGTARLRLYQKSVSRKVKGSSNSRKAKQKVARQHYRISCIRKDAISKASTTITKSASVVVLEDLNVAGMMKNHKLARAVADASMSELHRQIRFKAGWLGVPVVTADRWFPSSKLCSSCGKIKADLSLSEREFCCDFCGVVEDRDLNAAINLRNLAGSSPVTACRPGSSGPAQKSETKLLVGQEPNTEHGLSLFGSV